MFNWIKNIIKEQKEYSRRRQIEDYCNYVTKLYNENSLKIFGNFSYEGYHQILSHLLGDAKESLVISTHQLNYIIPEEFMILFRLRLEEWLSIEVITDTEDNFLKSLSEFSNLKIKKVSKLDKIFIVADHKSYWYLDPLWNSERKLMNKDAVFKAEVCFNGRAKVARLLS